MARVVAVCALAALCAVTLGLFAHVVRITDVDHSLAVDSVVLDTGNGTNTTLARQRPYIHPVLKRARQQHSAALSRQHTRQQPQLRPTQASQPASPIAEPATQASGAAGKRSSQRSASSLRKPVTGQPLASRPSQPLKPAPLSIQSFRFSFTDQHATAFTWERTPNVHRGWQGPLFKDLNGDGHLDYINNHHFGQCHKSNIVKPGSTSSTGSTCLRPYHWSIALKDPQALSYKRLRRGSPHFRITDSMKDDNSAHVIDVHSLTVTDLDGDGRLVKRTEDAYNALFWGSGAQEGDIITSKQPSFQFSGGRLTAHQAGLENHAADARHVVWLDANLDGALDVLLVGKSSPNFANEIVGSELFLSQGPGSRHWKLASQLVELTSTAILTDVDGDGWARELLLWRMGVPFCKGGQRKGVRSGKRGKRGRSRSRSSSSGVTDEMWQRWCREHTPLMSVAIVRIDLQGRLSVVKTAKQLRQTKMVEEWATADLDGDGHVDVIALAVDELFAFPSSVRKPGELPSSTTRVSIAKWDLEVCRGQSLAVADFDLDGTQELYVLCTQPGAAKLFVQHAQAPTVSPSSHQLAPQAVRQRVGYVEEQDLHHLGLAADMGKDAEPPGWLPLAWKGVSVADTDNDGFMDLYFIADGPALFLHNEAAQSRTLRQHNYVVLQLAGDGTAVSLQAVGTTVMVRSISDVGVERRQAREVRLAPRTHGFDDERLVFGLGPLGRVNEVVVRWPEGTQQRVAGRDLELNEVRVPNLIKFKGGLEARSVTRQRYVDAEYEQGDDDGGYDDGDGDGNAGLGDGDDDADDDAAAYDDDDGDDNGVRGGRRGRGEGRER